MPSRLYVLLVAAVVVALVGAAGIAVAEDPDHEHPEEVQDDDDLEAVQRWLGDRMGQIHVDCTEGMRVGNFDACEDLDEEYESYLSRYVSVERERTNSDDRQGDRYEETRDKQAELARLLQRFRATHEDYEDARARGDETAAREHARELLSLAERIEALGGDVAVNFRVLDNRTSADLNASAVTVDETTEEVVTIRRDVEEESFVGTELTVAADETASFGSPATVSGRVVDEDGDPIGGATIAIEDDETTTTVQTDEDGRFTAEYRPTLTEPGATNVTVRYVPTSTSVYLGSNANATVEVGRTPTTLTVSDATTEAGFGDEITVAGEVGAADRGAPGVPVSVVIEGRRIATDRTDEDGAFEVSTSMPPDVPAGDAEVVIRASRSNSALEPSEASATMTVTETETALNVTATEADGQVLIEGTLLAAGEVPVGQRPIEVTVGGETQTTTTEPDGSYAITVDPDAADREVTVAYDEAGSNLGPSTASTTLPGQPGAGGAGDGSGGIVASIADLISEYPGLAVGAVAALIAAVAAARALWSRREDDGAVGRAGPDAPGATGTAAGASAGVDPSRSHLERARELLATAPDEAVKASYAAVRTGLGGDDPVRTHWEFYNDRTADLPADREAALRALTEVFERAAFAPRGLERSDAEAAVAEAERCLATSDGGTSADAPGDAAVGRETTD